MARGMKKTTIGDLLVGSDYSELLDQMIETKFDPEDIILIGIQDDGRLYISRTMKSRNELLGVLVRCVDIITDQLNYGECK